MFTTTLLGIYVPLTWVSFGLDYLVWGMKPLGYHVTSLVIHALNGALFYLIAGRLLGKVMRSTPAALPTAAGVAALVFALHPLRVESVAWASARSDVLAGFFVFVTILTYLDAAEAAGGRRRILLATSLVSYALALASKSIVVTLPLILILLDLYPLRRLTLRWREWIQPPGLGVWWEKIPYMVLAIAGAVLSSYALRHGRFVALDAYPFAARVAIAGYNLWFYLWKTLVPWPLSPLYELPATVRLADIEFLGPTIAVALTASAVATLGWRWPAVLALGAYYVIALAPVATSAHSQFQLTADRYSYLACLGWALVIGAAAGYVQSIATRGALSGPRARLAAVIAVVWLAGLGGLTWRQAGVWRDDERLWNAALAADRRCATCENNLGTIEWRRGDAIRAKQSFERAVAVRPDWVVPHSNLGQLLVLLEEAPAAIPHLRLVVAKDPDDRGARASFGWALLVTGRYHEAVEHLEHALRLDPSDGDTRTNLGVALLASGRPAEAAARCREALLAAPDAAPIHFCLSRAYLALGKTDLAREHAERLRAAEVRERNQVGNPR